MNIKTSPRCNFCQLYRQDTIHMFYDCIEIKNSYFELNSWVQEEYGLQITLNPKSIILGDLNGNLDISIITLYAKYFIYKCKFKNVNPVLQSFKSFIAKY